MNHQIREVLSLLLLALCFLPLKAHSLDIMLPQVYSDDIDVTGWLMSEKLDGVRGYWNGKQLFSKNGHPLYPPPEFTRNFPPFPLEGELWGGRETFLETVSTVRKQKAHTGWLKLQFAIFDAPQVTGGFTGRMQIVKEWFQQNPSKFIIIIPQTIIKNNGQLQAELQRIETLGGEGLIVRKAETLYTKGRSSEILKVKSFFDEEAVVISHLKGKGKHSSRLGSLLVELSDKTQFKIGSGFSNTERENPPAIGSTITFKYYGFYPSGIPKFPSFLRIRTDISL